MKINPIILSIPPHISTTWSNISSMHVKEEQGSLRLIVILRDGPKIEIPNLSPATIGLIFDAHAQSVSNSTIPLPQKEDNLLSFSLPFKTNGAPFGALGASAQHNPDHADSPPLPEGILKKIRAIASALGLDSLTNLPQAEPGCNCTYCQIINAVHGTKESSEATEEEEPITENDLKFRNWEIHQTADKLYVVTNRIDLNEQYSVFLGEPIGCTCGQKNCEHIRAVLSEPFSI